VKKKVTEWYPAEVDPFWVGSYEMLNESTGAVFRAFFAGGRWFIDSKELRPLVRVWPWRGQKEPA
jgi:hypothetical protein